MSAFEGTPSPLSADVIYGSPPVLDELFDRGALKVARFALILLGFRFFDKGLWLVLVSISHVLLKSSQGF